MMHLSADPAQAKGWFVGPWNSVVPIPVGYAHVGVQEQHHHQQMFEMYLVARGWSTALVAGRLVHLEAGQLLVVEPGEVHTFVDSSADYLHFVIQTPFVADDKQLDAAAPAVPES